MKKIVNTNILEFYAISTIFFELSTYFEINYVIFIFFLDTIYFIGISRGEF